MPTGTLCWIPAAQYRNAQRICWILAAQYRNAQRICWIPAAQYRNAQRICWIPAAQYSNALDCYTDIAGKRGAVKQSRNAQRRRVLDGCQFIT